jgi:predicted DCC family thiol-disulfide oxidoreductase YuxK
MLSQVNNMVSTIRHRGIVCYDGNCSICRQLIGLFGKRLRLVGFRLAKLQDSFIRQRLGIQGIPDEMKLWLPNGQVLGGVDAVITLSEALGIGHDLAESARSPIMRPTLQIMYRFVAKHRRCANGTCRL